MPRRNAGGLRLVGPRLAILRQLAITRSDLRLPFGLNTATASVHRAGRLVELSVRPRGHRTASSALVPAGGAMVTTC
jgi:hypothetical protein